MPKYPAYEANIRELKKLFGKYVSKVYRGDNGEGYYRIYNKFFIRVDSVHLHYVSFPDHNFGGFAIKLLPEIIVHLDLLIKLHKISSEILNKRGTYKPAIYSEKEKEAKKRWRRKHKLRKFRKYRRFKRKN